MSSLEILKKNFLPEMLKDRYFKKISKKAITGLDKISSKKFESEISNEIVNISERVLSGKYNYTRYKKILISKGENKYPRIINIPTIRDKLTLSALNQSLNDVYIGTNCSPLPHTVIYKIKETIKLFKYDTFIKYDVETFYQTINHEILMKKLYKKIREKRFLKLINDAIKTDSIQNPIKSKEKRKLRNKGVPEGLSISNSLANIYLIELDKQMSAMDNLSYYRYIDDILILCNSVDKQKIMKEMNKNIKKIKLKFNEKTDDGLIAKKEFCYLGYQFNLEKLTVRLSSKYKLENSIEKMLSRYKYSENKNLELLEWRINLKITGCIYENKKYGWVFYFSQIDDLILINKLDILVKKLLARYNIEIKSKKFNRVYYEIKNALHNNNYIPNFDKFTTERKRDILDKIYKVKNINFNNDLEVEKEFKRLIFEDISILEKDIQSYSN